MTPRPVSLPPLSPAKASGRKIRQAVAGAASAVLDHCCPIAIILSLSFYISFSLLTLKFPAIHAEEAVDGDMILSILSNENYPLSYNYYAGVLRYYLSIPFFSVFGPTPFSLRLSALFNSVLLLIAFYASMRKVFNPKIASYSLILLLTLVNFAQTSKLYFYSEYIMLMLCFFSGLYCLHRFSEKGSPVFLRTAALLFGLGLHQKIPFLWYLTGLFLYGTFFRTRDLLSVLRRHAVSAAIFFLIGYSPTILYNVQTNWPTPRTLWGLVAGEKTHASVDNRDYVENLKTRWGHLKQFMDGDFGMLTKSWGITPFPPLFDALRTANRYLYVIAFCVLPLFLLRFKSVFDPIKNPVILVYILLLFLFFSSPLTTSNLAVYNLIVLLPFPQILLGSLLWSIPIAFPGRRFPRFLVGSILAFAMLSQAALNIYYHHKIKKIGGKDPQWSEASYDAAAYLLEKNIDPVVADGWPTHILIKFLTRGRVNLHWLNPNLKGALFSPAQPSHEEQKQFIDHQIRSLGLPIYLLWDHHKYLAQANSLQEIANRHGAQLSIIKLFTNDIGESIYALAVIQK